MLWDIQKAIYTELANDTTLMSKITGVFDEVPENQDYPYITLGEATINPYDTFGKKGKETTHTMHIWSDYQGTKELYDIFAEIERILENGITLENGTLVNIEFEFAQPIKEETIRHMPVRYRIVAQE